MKKQILFPILAAILAVFSNCQNTNKTCCGSGVATEHFASFASSKTFQDAHPAPLPTDTIHEGEMIKIMADDGAEANVYSVKKNDDPRFLMLFHEWWGLNDFVKNEADFYANTLNINVLCLDLYDGKLATNAETAGKLMGENDKNRSESIIRGAFKLTGEGSKVYTMGWCFGGGWSCQAAIIGGNQVSGCVIYYGMPEEDVVKLSTLNCDVLGIFATQDKWINQEVVSKFEENMRSANKKLTVTWYDADHAFANPSSPRFLEKPAQEAREVTLKFLGQK